MRVGIVGHEAAKFTPETEARTRALIRTLLTPDDVVVSGGCHLGGVDIWAEEEYRAVTGKEPVVFKPTRLAWSGAGGFQDRNIKIAEGSDIVHVIVVAELPASYTGMRFPNGCYHCKMAKDHVKSGGCWTARYALKIGRQAQWHIITEKP